MIPPPETYVPEDRAWTCSTPGCGTLVLLKGYTCALCYLYPQRIRDGRAGHRPLRDVKP